MQEPSVSFLVSVVVTSRRAGGQLDYRFPMYPSWADNECACPSPFPLPCPLLSLPAPRSKIITVKSTIIMGDFAPQRKKGGKERERRWRQERENEEGRGNYTQEESAKAASGEIGSNVANGSRMLGPRREKMIGIASLGFARTRSKRCWIMKHRQWMPWSGRGLIGRFILS